ncbi:MAG: D-2-hydroxyacid dehydrogenase [Planctomycetia bacterium]|nr:D-2-hydroxyacid dehydrogenase [Planctomycetia bacterium]
MKLVIHPPVDDARLAKIVAAAEDMQVVNAPDEPAALANMPDADAFFGKITPPLLAAAERLKWVQAPTASLEHYVFPELVEHPCQLTNMRGLFSDVIADHVFGFITCFARNFHVYIRNQLERRWQPVGGESERVVFTTGPAYVSAMDRAHRTLTEATLGIVGLGAIGQEVAKRGAAFGMHVLALDPMVTQPPPGVKAVWKPGRLPVLLAVSDYLVICAPHTPDTAKMFGREQFQLMKPTAYLINIGRGAIVDLTDLTAALEAGELAGAGLDVFEEEPLPADHPLWGMPNVILTPHVAGYSPLIAERHLAVLLANVSRFRHYEKLLNVVNKATWF